MLRLRPARHADAPACLALWRAAVAATHDFLSAEDFAAIAAEVAAMLPQVPMTVAVDEADQPLGFMIMDGAHMEALFIHPAHHGGGIGRFLVASAMASHGSLTTAVNEQNAGAAAFYQRLGFRPTGRSAVDGQGRPYPLIHLAQA
ncbi:acetyltransferase [Sphingomonas sp. IBVSS1]|nr:acetyltransferase [Sphingomonas sp. IBVSS1]